MLRELFAHDWAKLVAVGLVALFFGLIGMMVASGSEPVTAPPIEAVATPTTTSVPVVTTTTFITRTPSTLGGGGPTTTETAIGGDLGLHNVRRLRGCGNRVHNRNRQQRRGPRLLERSIVIGGGGSVRSVR